jgi:hypothetical protein
MRKLPERIISISDDLEFPPKALFKRRWAAKLCSQPLSVQLLWLRLLV